MRLKDHFRPPLSALRHWESFHSRWAAVIADVLEAELLPPGYFAEVQVHVGSRVEVDVAAWEDQLPESGSRADESGAVATAPRVWTPPAPAMVLPWSFPERVEVLIFSGESGPTLVAAIELVSPRNKDRRPARRAFATKCANYLQHGVGLVLVDVVTSRRANLHNELIGLLELPGRYSIDPESLYAVAYRPVQRQQAAEVQVWPAAVAVGDDLPTLPLPLDKGQCLPLDLARTYAQACQRMRLPE